jgi:hypothetical protein
VASSISQWPVPFTTVPVTSVATSLACSMRNVPDAFSPVRTRTGVPSLVAEKAARSLASCSNALKYSNPARMPSARA